MQKGIDPESILAFRIQYSSQALSGNSRSMGQAQSKASSLLAGTQRGGAELAEQFVEGAAVYPEQACRLALVPAAQLQDLPGVSAL